ncbi:MAG: hypothetical protein P1U46_04465 [Patescibacteria group bacterium]|nr:hypothetical protein [Patescibacteria group bacterium]
MKLAIFFVTCFSTISSAFSCKSKSKVVYIDNQPTLIISFPYFSSRYSFT